MMNNSQGASSFFSGLSTLLGRPHPLLHNLSDTTSEAAIGVADPGFSTHVAALYPIARKQFAVAVEAYEIVSQA